MRVPLPTVLLLVAASVVATVPGCAAGPRVSAVSIPVASIDRARAFYAAMLEETGQPDDARHVFANGTLILRAASTDVGAGAAIIEIRVANPDATAERGVARGAIITGSLPGGGVLLRDPFGNRVRLRR